MDEIVKQALIKWPNVPHCYGWLGLDMRGRWWMRDSAAQAAGAFTQNQESKGWLLEHAAMQAFICRNYQADDQGQWYFQNGPQRVYVELENTPTIWHWQQATEDSPAGALAHYALNTSPQIQPLTPQRYLVDEEGVLYLVCQGEVGVLYSQDVPFFVDSALNMDALEEVQRSELPTLFGFVRSHNFT